ncbi:MAG: hypothetical protein JHC40_01715 [Burkholderiales bacterium]|jgi:hypothetical protein|nr:hypothetical protein [Burkholderiales bacterium]
MSSTRRQMMIVAVLVCLFAVGMAGLLNFFKYRSNAERIVTERLVVTGKAIGNSIQSSLALGMQLADLGMLPETLKRERATDDLILSIEVFDLDGNPLYNTDLLRATRNVPADWLHAARRAGGKDWFVQRGTESAAGIAIETNFGLAVGYLALRYSDETAKTSTNAVARQLALATLGVFIAAALVASLALSAMTGLMSRKFDAVEAAVRSGDRARSSEALRNGPFGGALRRFIEGVRGAEAEIALVRRQLERGTAP